MPEITPERVGRLVELLICVAVVAGFYLTGVIPFDVEHLAFQASVWCGGVSLLRFGQSLR